MKTPWTLLTTAGALAAAGLIFAGRATQAQAPTAPPRYGVVNLREVMDQFGEVQDAQTKLEKRAAEFRQEGKARQEKTEDVRFRRDQEHPDSPKWFELQKELNRLSVELEIWTKLEKGDIQAEQRQQESGLYKRILAVVETVAKRQGLDAVFQFDAIDLNDPDEVVSARRMGVRAVIYASPTVDLTKDVIARLSQTSPKKGEK